jgi:hypothetical protein
MIVQLTAPYRQGLLDLSALPGDLPLALFVAGLVGK